MNDEEYRGFFKYFVYGLSLDIYDCVAGVYYAQFLDYQNKNTFSGNNEWLKYESPGSHGELNKLDQNYGEKLNNMIAGIFIDSNDEFGTGSKAKLFLILKHYVILQKTIFKIYHIFKRRILPPLSIPYSRSESVGG